MKKISGKATEQGNVKKKRGIQELKRFYHETIKGKITCVGAGNNISVTFRNYYQCTE